MWCRSTRIRPRARSASRSPNAKAGVWLQRATGERTPACKSTGVGVWPPRAGSYDSLNRRQLRRLLGNADGLLTPRHRTLDSFRGGVRSVWVLVLFALHGKRAILG